MTKFQKQFAKRFHELRILSGLSQEQIAEQLDVAMKTVSYWENGHNAVTFNKLPAIAKVLGVPVYKLFVFGELSSGDNQEIIDILNSMDTRERRVVSNVIKSILMLR